MMNVEKQLSRAYTRGFKKGLRMNLAELGGIIEERLPRYLAGITSDIVPLAARRKRGKDLFFKGLCDAHTARTKKRVVGHRPSLRLLIDMRKGE